MQNRFIDKEKLRLVILLLVLALIGLAIFWKTFQLEIYGDEWEGIWWTTSTLQQTGHFNDRIDYKAYELASTLLSFVSGAFNLTYSSTQVYLFSFLTRLFATFCLYYFLTKRNLPKIAVFLGSLLFLISPIGIQTTDWAKNFTSYISIGFLLLCLNSIYDLTTWKKVLIFLITFLLSIYTNPIRAHGVILTIIFLLIIQLLFQPKNKKLTLLSLFAALLIFHSLSRLSVFGDMNTLKNSYIQNLTIFFSQFNLAKFKELFFLVGRGVIPDSSLVVTFLLPVILFYWKRNLLSKKYLPVVLIFTLLSISLLFIVNTFTKGEITAIVGMHFIIFISLAFLVEIFNKRIEEAIVTITPLLLNLFFILIPLILERTDVTDSTHRYLIYAALSIPMIVAFALKDFENRTLFNLSFRNAFLCVCLLLTGIFFISVKSGIDDFYNRHNQILAETIWDQIMPYFNGFDFKHRRAVVYLDGDDGGILHDSVSFGFGYRMGFIYKIWDFDRLPIAVDSMKDLVSLITDGKAGQKYIQKKAIFPKEDAFYFSIEKTKVKKLPI